MNKDELPKFQELMISVGEYYQSKEPLSAMALQIYFAGLSKYSYDQVRRGIMSHISGGKSGSFFPKVSDVSLIIDGGAINKDVILSAARDKTTPLGILSLITIGSHDLNTSTKDAYLSTRAQECMNRLDEWRERAANNNYTSHERAVMYRHKVTPSSSLNDGIGVAYDASRVVESLEYKRLVSPEPSPEPKLSEDEISKNKDRIKSMIKRLFG
jgi:hypothetical protein